MHTPRIRNKILPHNLRVIQKDTPILRSRDQDRVAILTVYEIAVGEIGAVKGTRQAVAGQGCEEGCGTGVVAVACVGEVVHGFESVVVGTEAGETLGFVLRECMLVGGIGGISGIGGTNGAVCDVGSIQAQDEGGQVLGRHGVCLVDWQSKEAMTP